MRSRWGAWFEADPRAVGLATLSIGLKSFSDIVIIPIEDIPQDFHRIYMVYKRDAFRSRAVESFIEFTSDYVPPKARFPVRGHSRKGEADDEGREGRAILIGRAVGSVLHVLDAYVEDEPRLHMNVHSRADVLVAIHVRVLVGQGEQQRRALLRQDVLQLRTR